MTSKAKVKTGKNVLHKKGKLPNKGKPSYTKHAGSQGNVKTVGQDVKRLDPRSKKLPKGKTVGRDVVMTSKFEKQRKKMYGLSKKEDAGKI